MEMFCIEALVSMKFEMKYSTRFKQIVYFIGGFLYAAGFSILPFLFLYVLSHFAFSILFGEEIGADLAKTFFAVEIIGLIVFYTKNSQYYVKIDYRGVKISNYSFLHYGLRQPFRMNVIIPFDRIVGCTSSIPVDCPPNFRYAHYNGREMIARRRNLKRGKDINYIREPALAGGRYDKECVLLELDNKRIIVIPIDECDEFVELLDKYMQQYRELVRQRGNGKNDGAF